ncbi:sensor domain-containing diguanylate cyclase [Salinibius halmophilus]|uniref:sensor domain-containing diguanylate cyclase n=1 Tax=Salinibius halmophilus TaxID=1853216 RepID=UPI000E6756CD|nr:sensor domain-containing diguanylate cyclase [Salinibius halmophilus]
MASDQLFRTITMKPLKKPPSKEDGLEVYYLHELYLASLAAYDETDFYDMAQHIVRLAVNKLDFDRFGVLLYDDVTETIHGTWGTDARGNIVDESTCHTPATEKLSPIVKEVRDRGQIVVWEDTPIVEFSETEEAQIEVIGQGWNAAYAFWYAGKPVGWIAADNALQHGPFDSIHQQLFRMMGDLLGESFRQIKQNNEITQLNQKLEALNEQLSKEASHDHLTGLPNRKLFYQTFDKKHSFCAREGHCLAIALLDLDHFKCVNDEFGHATGDSALQALAQTFKKVLRNHDFVARLGGEEFAIMIVGKTRAESLAVCERVRAAVEEFVGPAAGLRQPITASIGLYHREQPEDVSAMLKYADKALYLAKDQGRNQVVAFE